MSSEYFSKRRVTQRQALLKLEQKRDSLVGQVSDELKRRSALQQQSEIVSALCDSLLYVLADSKHYLPEQQQQQQLERQQDVMLQRVVELLEAEGQLLARLQGLPSVQHELLQAAGVDNTGQPTIAPPDDPMALFKDLTSRPLAENASTVTSLEMIAAFKAVVSEVAVHLQLLDACLLPREACSKRIKRTMDRQLHCFASCQLLGRTAMLKEYASTNADTLEGPDTTALSRHLPNVAAAVANLQLTPAQQQAITEHWKVWTGLLAPVNEEISDLQQQIQESCQQDSDTFKNSSSTSTSGGPIGEPRNSENNVTSAAGPSAAPAGCAAAAAAGPAAAMQAEAPCAEAAAAVTNGGTSSSGACSLAGTVEGPERAEVIEAQMQLADRLQVVINKKLLLQLACISFFVGRLSWVQFARLLVLTWPFPVSFEYACLAVVQQYEASQQQQQVEGDRHG